jgi:hypothetical protein
MADTANRHPLWIHQAALHKILRSIRDVIHLTAARVLHIQIPERLPISITPAIVRLQYYKASAGQILRPRIAAERVLSLRPAMHPLHQWQ